MLKKAITLFEGNGPDKNEDRKIYLPLPWKTFTGSTGVVAVAGVSGRVLHLGIGCNFGIGWDWQQQELKLTAQAIERTRVIAFIENER